MEDCIFCKIAKKEIPSKTIYEDEYLVAFHDIAPVAPVHVLIVPKTHIPSVMQIEDFTIVQKIYEVAQKLAVELGVAQEGFRLVNNCGQNGGQTVGHLHFHLIGGRQLGIMG